MRDIEFLITLAVKAAHECETGVKRLWYLSFATQTEFVGSAIVTAQGPVTARLRLSELGINPRGQMLAIEVPYDAPQLKPGYEDRLLSKEELEVLFAADGGVRTFGEISLAMEA